MYLDFYGLKKEPFSISPDHHFLYLSEVHKEGLAYLRYGLIQKKGFIVITGEVGTGKTTLINALLSEIPQEVNYVVISNPKLTKDEFFYLLVSRFGLGTFSNKAEFLVRFTEFLQNCQEKDLNVVLIVDEAHCLSEELLEEIRLLSNLETPSAKLLNIILVGQPEFEKILNRPELRALKQRVTLRYKLTPLNEEETFNYIKVRLSRAGASDVGIFTTTALKKIYHYTEGVPRLINLLADHSLLTGFVKEQKKIDKDIVEECAKEIGLEEKKTIAAIKDVNREGVSWSNFVFKINIFLLFLMFLVFFLIALFFDNNGAIDVNAIVKVLRKLWVK